MLRFYPAALSAFLFFSLLFIPGCNRSQLKVVGVIPKGNADLFWQSVHAGAIKSAQENKLNLIWNGPPNETDFSTQLKIVETMIDRHVDAIALAPSDKEAMVNVVERAESQGIPVVIYDSAINTDKYASFIATDNYAAGEMAGERIGQILKGKGKIVMLKTSPGGASTTAREDGCRHVLQTKYPGVQILDERFGMATVSQALDVAENMLTAHPDLDAMFASSESSSNGALQALRHRGKNVKLVAFDWSPVLLDALKNHEVDSLVIQDPFKMGEEAVKVCAQILNHQPITKQLALLPRLVTAENINDPEIQAQVNPDLKKYLGR